MPRCVKHIHTYIHTYIHTHVQNDRPAFDQRLIEDAKIADLIEGIKVAKDIPKVLQEVSFRCGRVQVRFWYKVLCVCAWFVIEKKHLCIHVHQHASAR